MGLFFFDDKTNTYYKEIKRLMNASMNGVTSERMKNMGYELNYGVCLTRIKEIALRYDKSMKLSTMLWNSNCRELKIAATFIQDPNKMSQELAMKWIKECFNQELTDQLAKNLLVETPCINEIIDELAKQNDGKKMLYTLTSFATKQDRIAQETIDNIISLAEKDLYTNDEIARSATRFLRSACKTDKSRILNIVEHLDTSYPIAAWVKEELLTEIEFGD